MPAHAYTSARRKRATSFFLGALLLGAAGLHPGEAHAVAITQTLSAGPSNLVSVNTGAGSIVGVINFTDSVTDSNVNQGPVLGFNGFDSSLGTLDLVTWGFSGFHRVRGRASTTCVAVIIVLPIGFCEATSTTTAGHTLFADIVDSAPGGIELQSAINNFQVTATGGGIIPCLIFGDCETIQNRTRNFNTSVVRSGSALSAYIDVPTIDVALGSILTVRNEVACVISIATLSECFAEGEGIVTSSLSVSLTYDFTPASTAIPLPATVWLLAVALAGLGAIGLRR